MHRCCVLITSLDVAHGAQDFERHLASAAPMGSLDVIISEALSALDETVADALVAQDSVGPAGSLEVMIAEASETPMGSLDALMSEAAGSVGEDAIMSEAPGSVHECYYPLVLADSGQALSRLTSLLDDFQVFHDESVQDVVAATASLLDNVGSNVFHTQIFEFVQEWLSTGKTTNDREYSRRLALDRRSVQQSRRRLCAALFFISRYRAMYALKVL